MLVDGTSVGRSVVCPECRYLFRVESFQSVKPGTDPALPFAESSDSSDRGDESEELPLKTLGRFELRKVLGKGGFGRVYLAWDPHLERLVALKVAFSGPENGKQRERVLREAKAQLLLQHAAIVPALECDQIDGCLYIVFEYVEGETLSSRLRRGPVEKRQAVEWVRDLADALAFAHANRVIHRDVKPHNILIDATGRPFITDFGLVHWLDNGGDLTKPGSFTGTIPYMAPELLSGHEQAGGTETDFYRGLDQYSLGVVLYELLTGRRPFEGRFTAVVAMKIAQEPPCPSRHDGSIPDDLAAICLKALRRDPEHRHRNCASLAMALTEWLTESEKIDCPVQEPRQSNGPSKTAINSQPQQKALRLVVSASALLLVAVGIASVWSYFHPENTSKQPSSDAKDALEEPLPTIPFVSAKIDLILRTMSAEEVRQSQQACASDLKVPTTITNSIGMTLCLVPSGQFVKGTSRDEIKASKSREPEHSVEISAPFYIGQLEVTVEQYHAIFPPGTSGTEAVGNITYKKAIEFCQKLTEQERNYRRFYRLPTEAEWEFVSQANLSTSADPRGGALGLDNLAGGVSEWCSDWYDETFYEKQSGLVKDPSGPSSGKVRVVRGGSNSHEKQLQGPELRVGAKPEANDDYRGFRVLLEIVK